MPKLKNNKANVTRVTKTKATSKTKRGKTGSTKTIVKTSMTSPYAGKAGRRQYQIDKAKISAGSKITQTGDSINKIASTATAGVTANTALSREESKRATQSVDSWNKVINGVSEPAEGTGEALTGETTYGSTNSIPKG